MKRKAKYRMPFKRKFKKKTDYRKRLKLLYSKKPRIIIRKTSKHVKAQIAEFDLKGDKIIVSATTQDLKKFGWTGSTNIPSAYLTGLLIGKRALKKKVDSAILDMGLEKSIKGSKIYAVLKGAIDAGLSIPVSADILPSDERISGKHIIDYAQKLKKEDVKKYKKQFSVSKPELIPVMLEKVKLKIMK